MSSLQGILSRIEDPRGVLEGCAANVIDDFELRGDRGGKEQCMPGEV